VVDSARKANMNRDRGGRGYELASIARPILKLERGTVDDQKVLGDVTVSSAPTREPATLG